MKSKVFFGVTIAMIGNLIWAINTNFLKYLSYENIDAITITGIRLFFASVFLFGYLLFIYQKKQIVNFFPKENKKYYLLMGLAFAASTSTWMLALKLTSVANVFILGSASMIFTFTIGHFWLKEKITAVKIIAILLSLAGACVIIISSKINVDLFSNQKIFLGNLIALSHSFFWGMWYLFSRRLGKNSHSLLTTTWSCFVAFLVLSPWTIYGLAQYHISAKVWFIMITTGIMAQGVGVLFINIALRKIEAAFASLIGTTEIFFGVIFAYVLFSEIPTKYTYLGGILIIIAVVMLTLSQRKNPA